MSPQSNQRPVFKFYGQLNPLTPVPLVTARGENWPFSLFCSHHFWPKLASSILDFCRRKRSFQLLQYVNFCSCSCQRSLCHSYKLCISNCELVHSLDLFTVSRVNKASKHGVRIKNCRVTARCQATSELRRLILLVQRPLEVHKCSILPCRVVYQCRNR